MTTRRRQNSQSGQTLLLGVVMLLVLAVALLLAFDVHNVIRAKLKVETAQEAAALAAASWQKESLNLIGEINLIKAAETLLANDEAWGGDVAKRNPYDPVEEADQNRRYEWQARIGLLTEMQTRVAFLGPLAGFAAANQAAKANGLADSGASRSLQTYYELLETAARYSPMAGGAPQYINNYAWKAPYRSLVGRIAENGAAIMPNVRSFGSGSVSPPQLAKEDFYDAIARHAAEIAAGNPPQQSSWHDLLYDFVKKWRNADFQDKWWNVDFSMANFPGESEIYTLGVQWQSIPDYQATAQSAQRILGNTDTVWPKKSLPAAMDWCCYDKFWYPEYYRDTYRDYQSDHYSFWFESGILRRNVKSAYRYEGPAAYAEGGIDVPEAARLATRPEKTDSTSSIFFKRNPARSTSNRVGSRRSSFASSSDAEAFGTNYRPGVIAKAFGELSGGRMPIEIPVILPVFDRTTVMPTYMPVPYGFAVLRLASSKLDAFLAWLAGQDSLFDYEVGPGADGAFYLAMLQKLTDGAGFRYYGYNPAFDAGSFDNRWRDRLKKYVDSRKSEVYAQNNRSGAGWLQEPQLFYGDKSTWDTSGGTRVYIADKSYYVVDTTGHIITNDESDPTVRYTTIDYGSGGGGGPGFGQTVVSSDTAKGTPRL
ncbi:MAG: pilus assembly protein TadG-related protein [Victivallaceae bacterium]|nr:pilus assembly protein TadG-related protein [Victivallaceae bacterium]